MPVLRALVLWRAGKVKFPAFLRVAHYRWRLVRMNRADEDTAGYCDTEKHEIGVAKEGDLASDDEEASALVHEWIHAVMHIHFPEIEDDEPITLKLESIIMQALRDNKTTIRAILKALK